MTSQRISLGEIFRVFLFIGTTGFGGGMAVVSLTERVCVHDKKWLNHDEFMHGLAFGQILGPFSLNISTFVGYYLRGVAGGIVAAAGFILPSFCLITLFSWIYFTFHQMPQLSSALAATNPVIIGLVLVAAIGMGRRKLTTRGAWLMAVMAYTAAALFNVSALWILIVAVVWAFVKQYLKRKHV